MQDDKVVSAQKLTLKYVRNEYPIKNLVGLSHSKELGSDTFFIQGQEHKSSISLCENKTCTKVPLEDVCEDGFELLGKKQSSGFINVACIPISISFGFMQKNNSAGVIEYSPVVGEESPSIWYAPLAVKENGLFQADLACYFIPKKLNS
jgi:hypothetical protein